MQHAFSDNLLSTPKSEVLLLPIIDLSPSDETCIYSTLTYIERQIHECSLQAWRLPHNDELYGKHRINDEGLRFGGSIRNSLWP